MSELICSPPKLRRLVHIDKDLGVVATSPLPSPLPADRTNKLRIPKLKIPDQLSTQSQSSCSPLSLLQFSSSSISTSCSPSLLATPIANSLVSCSSSSSLDLESKMVDGAIDNVVTLPQMVRVVSNVEKGQSNEISKQMIILAQLEAQVEKEQKKNSEMLVDLSNMTKKIYVTEDLVNKKQKSCDTLEKEIEELVADNSVREKARILKLEDIVREKRRFDEYILKMKKHKEIVINFEHTEPLYNSYLNKTNTVQKLQQKYDEINSDAEKKRFICSGEKEEEIKQQIQELEDKEVELHNQLENKNVQFSQLSRQEEKIKQNINVLHKRNTAQLTRLKKQVKDQQYRHQQWIDQISHLNKIISDLQRQIEDC